MQDPALADVLLLNTCSIREKAQEKVFSELGRWKELKDRNPSLVIGVGGCVASQEGEAIRDRAPYVDLVFGPQTLHRLPQMLDEFRRARRSVIDGAFPDREVRLSAGAPRRWADGLRFRHGRLQQVLQFLRCALHARRRGQPALRRRRLPNAWRSPPRGCAKSRSSARTSTPIAGAWTAETLRERAWLREQAWNGADFPVLLDYLAEVPGVERIRFTTSHPREFTQRLVDCHARIDKLVSHVHLPVQSGSDRVLAAMKRGYTALEYKATVRALRAVRPGISISSDFIVGFPGETERDFGVADRG